MHLYVFRDVREVVELYEGVGFEITEFDVLKFKGRFIDTYALCVKN